MTAGHTSSPKLLKLSKVLLEERADLGDQSHQVLVQMWGLTRRGVKVLLADALVEEETKRRGSDEVVLTFQCGEVKVQKVTLHLPPTGRGIPGAVRQRLQALWKLTNSQIWHCSLTSKHGNVRN